jgi:hypothetical protein
VSKTVKPGKLISRPLLSTVPVVVSTWNDPEKSQKAKTAQEPKGPSEVFCAVPDTSNVVTVSAYKRARQENERQQRSQPRQRRSAEKRAQAIFHRFLHWRMFCWGIWPDYSN